MSATSRNNVRVAGHGDRAMVFAHGFGCDQAMWRFVAPAFEANHRVITYDHVGSGGSDLSAYSSKKYGSLDGYASDLVEIGRELGLKGAVFVGHSVSAMIGALASIKEPEMFDTLVMVGPSPRYIDAEGYIGGFSEDDIKDLLKSFDENPLAWSASMGPAIMGNADRPELGAELTASFCRADPAIASEFARVTFTSDNRADLARVTARTLVVQCREDIIAQVHIGEYVRDHIERAELIVLDATGHCPNLSAPAEVIAAIRAFV